MCCRSSRCSATIPTMPNCTSVRLRAPNRLPRARAPADLPSSLRLHPQGTGRLLLVGPGFTGIEPDQLLRRLLDPGNYRKTALLGLPVPQAGIWQPGKLETRLADLTTAVGNAG